MAAELLYGYDPSSPNDTVQPPIPPRHAGVVERWTPPEAAPVRIISPNCCRAGRNLLGWSVPELERLSGIDRNLIARFEATTGDLTDEERTAVHAAMTVAGVEYLPDPKRGPGLHLNRVRYDEMQNASRAAANSASRQGAAS